MVALALASGQRAPQVPALGLLAEQGVKDSEGDASLFEWEVSVSAAAAVPPAAREE